MSKPRPRKTGNPDLRRKTNQPGVEIPEITKKIFELENTIKKMIQWSCGFRQNFHKPFGTGIV